MELAANLFIFKLNSILTKQVDRKCIREEQIDIWNNIYIYIYIYTHFVEYNRHFLSTYFLVDPFILPYWSYSIRRELIDISSTINISSNYGRYINQFPLNIIRSIRQHERINKKICRQKMSIIFNEICINEETLSKYTYTLTSTDRLFRCITTLQCG